MKPYISNGSDYAMFETQKWKAYYGSGEIDPVSEEWLFVLVQRKPNGLEKEVARYTNSQLLEVSNGEGPKDLLIAGLALYFS